MSFQVVLKTPVQGKYSFTFANKKAADEFFKKNGIQSDQIKNSGRDLVAAIEKGKNLAKEGTGTLNRSDKTVEVTNKNLEEINFNPIKPTENLASSIAASKDAKVPGNEAD